MSTAGSKKRRLKKLNTRKSIFINYGALRKKVI